MLRILDIEVRDVISILSAFIVAIGWYVTGHLNRKKDVAQKRLEYRLKGLEASLTVFLAIAKHKEPFMQPGVLGQLEDARVKFQLYGFQDEIDAMEQFIKALEKRDIPLVNESLGKLVPLVRSRIRKELNIDV
jgi:hypothetical protein